MEELFNDPELNGKYLGTITSDFIKVADNLKEASFQIRQSGITKYPIFPIAKEAIQIGRLLYSSLEFETGWNYFASLVEEFVQRKLITEENLEAFKASYKDPDEFCCLFVVDKEFINFVFIPYPEDN